MLVARPWRRQLWRVEQNLPRRRLVLGPSVRRSLDGSKWQMQEFMQTQLQFTAGNVDADGSVLAVNCYCFYTDDKGPNANPTGALWRILPADKVPAGAELAKAK